MKYTAPEHGVEGQHHELRGSERRASPYSLTSGFLKPQTGQLYLPRFSTTIHHQSSIEADCLRLLSYDPEIVDIQRATPLNYHSADGQVHEYNADFDIKLRFSTGTEIQQTLECKPLALLMDIIASEPQRWLACAEIVRKRGSELLFVTDHDLRETWLAHAKRFTAYQLTPGEADLEQLIFSSLAQKNLPLGDLRRAVAAQYSASGLVPSGPWFLRLDSTLSSLIARRQIHADSDALPNEHCLIGLPNRMKVDPPRVLGTAAVHLIQQAYATNHQPDLQRLQDPEFEPGQASAIHQERKLLKSARGQALQQLFSLYSDPTVKLDQKAVQHLTNATGVPRSTIFRFQTRLREAGAPGITFTQIVPLLVTQRQRPTRQVDDSIRSIIETLVRDRYLAPVGAIYRATGVANLHKLVCEACEVENLPPPALTTVQRQLDQIRDRDPVFFETRRNGADKGYQLEARLGSYPVLLYGELLAIDCTPCDAFATVDSVELWIRKSGKGKGQGRPGAIRGNVIQFTEVATRQVLSSRIYLRGVKASMVIDDLQRVILGDHRHAADRGVTHLPQLTGIPAGIRLDRGLEFINKEVTRIVQNLGIQVVPRDKSNRHRGGVEERTIGTIVRAHHILPGTTMSSIDERQCYQASEGARLDFDTLDTYHQRSVEVYNRSPAPQQGVSRHDHAAQLITRGSVALRVPSATELAYIQDRMRPQELRTCLRDGVHIFSLRYVSMDPAFRMLVQAKREVEVVFNPENIGTVQVVHPDSGLLITVTARFPEGVEAPISRDEWLIYHRRMYAAQLEIRRGLPSPQKVLAETLEEKAAMLVSSQKRKGRPKADRKAADKAGRRPPEEETFSDDGPVAEIVPFYLSKESV